MFQAFNVELGDFNAVKRFPLQAIDDESLQSIEVSNQRYRNHYSITSVNDIFACI